LQSHYLFFAYCMSKFHIRVSFAKPLLISFSLMCIAKYTGKVSTGIILYVKIIVIFPLRETGGLPCAPGARQRHKNAQQSFCGAFFIGTHGKRHTVAFCTVKSHCRAPCLTMHGELSLPCVMGRRTAKKST
jgi:hypothetical protein